jgi:UDP-N-acetyl-D-glucosamine dehydrogenase
MPEYVIGKVTQGLNDHKKAINGSKILVLGIAYKKNVDDMRESPSVEIMEQLQQHGATVEYSDNYVPVFPKMRRYSFDLKTIELTKENIQSYDCIVVATNHDDFDYPMILQHAKLIVDTRGMYRANHKNVVHA